MYDADLEGYFAASARQADGLFADARGGRKRAASDQAVAQAPVVETGQEGKSKVKRNEKGTPQGGVISPLLANIYLHWFDSVFCRADGPGQWAKAKLVRYCDDFS